MRMSIFKRLARWLWVRAYRKAEAKHWEGATWRE